MRASPLSVVDAGQDALQTADDVRIAMDADVLAWRRGMEKLAASEAGRARGESVLARGQGQARGKGGEEGSSEITTILSF